MWQASCGGRIWGAQREHPATPSHQGRAEGRRAANEVASRTKEGCCQVIAPAVCFWSYTQSISGPPHTALDTIAPTWAPIPLPCLPLTWTFRVATASSIWGLRSS